MMALLNADIKKNHFYFEHPNIAVFILHNFFFKNKNAHFCMAAITANIGFGIIPSPLQQQNAVYIYYNLGDYFILKNI